MNKVLLLISAILFALSLSSCSKFINLGDTSNDKGASDDLPEELSDSENSYGDTGSGGDTGNTGDTADTGDTGDAGDTSNTATDDAGDTNDTGDTGTDMNDSDNEVSDESSYLDSYPFSEEFTSDDCACGKEPEYAPVCCNGNTSVFSACFANCYYLNSQSRVCSEYADGVCESLPEQNSDEDVMTDDSDIDTDTAVTDDDALTLPDEAADDSDITETGDSDPVINNECGCYPADTGFYCCYVNGTVFISKCMADCHCNGGYTDCF